VFTAGGGAGAYFGNESSKAGRAAVGAEKVLSTLSEGLTKELMTYIGGARVQDLKNLHVEKLDALADSGDFGGFLKRALEELRTNVLQKGEVRGYRGYGVVETVLAEANELEDHLTSIESLFKERVTNRAKMRQVLEAFRKEFAPIRDFLGNDFDNFMVDVSHERIDNALARCLPAFGAAPQVRAADQVRKPFFPECSKEVDQWVLSSENQELTSSERKELMHGIATLLSYKVLNLQRSPVVGYPRPVQDVLPMCSAYLEEARKLKGGEASPLDSVLLWRVAAALKEPRAVQLRETVDAAVNRALNDQTYAKQLSSQDLGILAKQLVEEYRYAEALKLFDVMLANADMVGGDQTALSASRYFGEYGRATCLFFLACAAIGENVKGSDAVANYLDEATSALQRSLAHLTNLPPNTADRGTREANVYLALARVESRRYGESRDSRHLVKLETAHVKALYASSGPRVSWLIGATLFSVGDYEGAAKEYSKALASAPYFSNELWSQRAQCYANLGREDEMLLDVNMVLKTAQSSDAASTVEPKNLSKCALALAVYMWPREKEWPHDRRDDYLKLMKTLLGEVQRRCSSGFPYAVEQLDLKTEFFNVLKTYDPAFWDAYVTSVSSGARPGQGRK